MARITNIDPSDWDKAKANVVQLDVDAPNNVEAVEALEDWAAANGFARVRENFLRVVVRADGTRVFRGACYRLTAEETNAVRFELDAIANRAKKIAGIGQASKSAS